VPRRPKKRDPWSQIESFVVGLGARAGEFLAQNPGIAGIPASQLGGGAQEIFFQLREWSTHLTASALGKWAPNVLRGQTCVVEVSKEACGAPALLTCDVCGRPCCLAHARIDHQADAICAVCIAAVRHARGGARAAAPGPGFRRAPPPPPEPKRDMTPREAFKVLGLSEGTDWPRVKRHYRRLAALHNADRPQSDAEREANTRRLTELNLAYAVLKSHYEEAAA